MALGSSSAGGGALGQLSSGMGGLAQYGLGQLLGGQPSPGIPNAQSLTNRGISQYYYGLQPHGLHQMQRLQEKQDSGGDLSHHQQHVLDSLQSRSEHQAILPQFIAAQQKYLPQFQDMSNQMLTSQANTIGNLQQNLTQQYDPQYQQIKNNVGSAVNSQIGMGLSPQETQYFTQQMAANEAAHGRYGSPLSSQNIALQLTPLDMQQRQQNISNAMNYGQYYPNMANQILGIGLSSTPSGSQLSGGSTTPMSYGNYQDTMNQLNTAAAGANYQSRLNDYNQLTSSFGQAIGGLIGTGANLGMMGMMGG